MSDSFTEVSSTSWLSRIKSALFSIITGFVFVIAAVVALFWNEGRAVKTAKGLAEGAGLVQSIDATNPTSDAQGKLVHISGPVKVNGVPQDARFSMIKAPEGATRLVRKVEMYQWKENKSTKTEKKLGGGEETVTTYSYTKVWSERAIDSSGFRRPDGHQNPVMDVSSETFNVPSATIGTIEFAGARIGGLGKETPITMTDETATAIGNAVGGTNKRALRSGDTVVIGFNPASPAIGDMRISFASRSVESASAIGKLDGNKLSSYTTSFGTTLNMLTAGTVEASKMFDDAISANTTTTWLFRLGGLIGMFIGFRLMFSIFGVLGDVIPFIGDIFRFATSLVALALTAVIGTLTIGIAWIYFRPVLGAIIIAVGLAIGIASIVLGKRRAQAGREAAAAAA